MMTLSKVIRSVTVEPVLFLYMLIIFLENNALLELIYTKACFKILRPENTTICNYESRENQTAVLKEATFWGKYCSACLSVCTLLTSVYVASWSDRIGRRPLMCVPPIGSLVASAINCALSIHMDIHVAYFFVSAAISGLTFGTVGVISSTFGYIADVTVEESRTTRIVILEAMIFIGGTCGIGIAGLFLKSVDFNLVFNQFAQLFAFEMVMAAIIVGYIFIRIPGHSSSMDNQNTCSKLFNPSHIRESFKTVFKKRPGGKRLDILLMLLALFLLYFGSAVQFTLSYYYVKKDPLHWSFAKYSVYNSIQFGIEGAALLVGLPVALHIFKLPDYVIGITGTLSRMAGFILFGLGKNDAMIYSCAVLFIFSEFPVPTIRSMLSKIVDTNEKGKIFAFTTILQNICYLCCSLTLNTLFESTLSFFHGFSFELVACFHAFTIFIFWYLHVKEKRDTAVYKTMKEETGDWEETRSITETI